MRMAKRAFSVGLLGLKLSAYNFFLATMEFMSARLQKVIKSLISEVETDNTPKSDTRMLNSELKHVQVLHCIICKKTCTK